MNSQDFKALLDVLNKISDALENLVKTFDKITFELEQRNINLEAMNNEA